MSRTDKAIGNYATHELLLAEVKRLVNVRPNLSQNLIAKQVGVSPGTVSSIVKDMRAGADPVQVDLNKMFNELWKIT
jgi:hypothetical protein